MQARSGGSASVVVLLLALFPVVTHSAATNAVTRLPPIVQPDLNGTYVYLSNICYPGEELPRKPRSVVIINFMGIECEPCKKELPQLLEVWRAHKQQGVRLFLMCTDEFSKKDKLPAFLKQFNVDCEVLIDPHKSAANRMGVMDKGGFGSIPRTFVVSKTGTVVGEIGGAVENYEATLRRLLGKALKQKP